jgi:uncharacterized membrane protein YkvA (DUF1232 family)
MKFVEKLKASARKLKNETYALWLAYRHPRTPWYAKVFAACVVAYALSPIDLIPDFIPILGYLDDLVLVPLGIALSLRMIPKDVMKECREKAETLNSMKLGKNWFAAVAVMFFWVLVLAVAGFFVWRVIKGKGG